jgi:hypothetical protein
VDGDQLARQPSARRPASGVTCRRSRAATFTGAVHLKAGQSYYSGDARRCLANSGRSPQAIDIQTGEIRWGAPEARVHLGRRAGRAGGGDCGRRWGIDGGGRERRAEAVAIRRQRTLEGVADDPRPTTAKYVAIAAGPTIIAFAVVPQVHGLMTGCKRTSETSDAQ